METKRSPLVVRLYRGAMVFLLGALLACSSENETISAGAQSNASTPVSEPQPPAVHPGAQTYTRYCFSCHAAGVAGAPKVGEADAWVERIAKGRELLLANSIEGMPPGMPAKGLCSSCTAEQLDQAIDYMIRKSQPAE